jgi:hypothetical protein
VRFYYENEKAERANENKFKKLNENKKIFETEKNEPLELIEIKIETAKNMQHTQAEHKVNLDFQDNINFDLTNFQAVQVKFENGLIVDTGAVVSCVSKEIVQKQKDVQTICRNFKIIENLSKIELPLTKLTLKKSKFEWTKKCQEAFELLKLNSTTELLLPYLFGMPFKVYKNLQWLFDKTDPSSRLVRWRMELSESKPEIIYKSDRKNQNADALSRIDQINIVEDYAAFCRNSYKPILNLNINECKQDITSAPTEQTLIIFIFSELTFTDPYQMSLEKKYGLRSLILKLPQPLKVGKNGLYWSRIRLMLRYIFRSTFMQINVYKPPKSLISKNDQIDILKEFHDDPLGGHQGITRTYKRIKAFYNWKGMKTTISEYIKSCESCQKTKEMEKNDRLHGYVRKHSYIIYTLCILLVCYIAYRIYKRCRSNNCCGKLCIRVEQNVQLRLEISI